MNGGRHDVRFESMLAGLREAVDFPPERDLTAPVRARIESPVSVPVRSWRISPRFAFALVIAFVAAVTATMALFPGVRAAVADWLGISGIEIRVQDDLPEPSSPPSVALALQLGESVTLEDARARAAFDIEQPGASGLGDPDVYFVEPPVGGAVSLVYSPSERLPQTSQAGVGLLITQFEADLHATLIKKVATEGSRVKPVTIGDEGYWIKGAPHALLYVDAEGEVREDLIRLADNTLVWEEDGVSYRLESKLGLRDALAIARSMR